MGTFLEFEPSDFEPGQLLQRLRVRMSRRVKEGFNPKLACILAEMLQLEFEGMREPLFVASRSGAKTLRVARVGTHSPSVAARPFQAHEVHRSASKGRAFGAQVPGHAPDGSPPTAQKRQLLLAGSRA